MTNFHSPLRYPGGKSKIAHLFADIIKLNKIEGCTYVEPFAGGASIALYLLKEMYVDKIAINDADISIFSFWNSVLNSTDGFCKLLCDTPISVDQWRNQRSTYFEQRNLALSGLEYDSLLLGFATFYLNRTNRSGIIKAGVIGGNDQTGNYGIDARFNKSDLEKRIIEISKISNKIDLFCKDAKVFIPEQAMSLGENTLFYFDPPYVVKGKGLYMNFFKDKDHEEISNVIQSIKNQHWIVTYDTVPLIESLYQTNRIRHLLLNYSAHTHKVETKEYIVFSDNIEIPRSKLIQKLQ